MRLFFFPKTFNWVFTSIIDRHKKLFAQLTPPFTIAIIIFLFSCIVPPSPAATSPLTTKDTSFDSPTIPSKYGEVIYRINNNSPKLIFIIGISHRNPENGLNSINTVQTQAEIFRIGEWLNRKINLELLLPEGFFRKKNDYSPALARPVGLDKENNFSLARLNNVLLHEKLADETRFVNAEMLLMEHFDMRASQVEDRKAYNAVRNSLNRLTTKSIDPLPLADRIAELRYLQQKRTAMLMQKIPSVIENEHINGTIKNHSAMFTIGLDHINDTFAYGQP